ncbi:PRD domain-containing protein [Clostridium gasigenes]|uniref:PRD domain-containing protein n=1 Tax=Clostridium gasigenes TaxID=94869 RepID=UPI001C0D01AC|nr:PRD domain-containing protein [Clostridium gasigenes]MBU3106050.1 PRD domain-containing protein [Clostridium gasigenes]
MGIILKNKVVVVKVFNNNIILVRDKGIEKVLFAKGLGFGKKFGETLNPGLMVEKLFKIENEDNQRNMNEVISRVDPEFFALCQEAIVDISEELGEKLNESIHIGLVDHLSFAIKRIESNEEIENPFLVEIQTLYKKEFNLAVKLAKKIGDAINVKIPNGEAGFIALHIHSARNNGNLSNTIKYSSLSNTIVRHVEKRLDIEIDRESLDYARFLIHIRFAVERILLDNHIKNDLMGVIKKRYKVSYKIAEEASIILEKGLDKKVTKDEIAYLAMHIERFKSSIEKA